MAAEGYEQAKQRLDEILEAVSDENMPLDDALALYEEAVKLGTRISGLVETGIAEADVEAAVQAGIAQDEAAAKATGSSESAQAADALAESA